MAEEDIGEEVVYSSIFGICDSQFYKDLRQDA